MDLEDLGSWIEFELDDCFEGVTFGYANLDKHSILRNLRPWSLHEH